MDDVKEMAKTSGRIKYAVIWKPYFGLIVKHMFKNQTKNKLTQDNYHANNFHDEDKRKLYLFLDKMLSLLRKYIGFKAVLGANYAYFDQQEFEKLCTDRKIPYIVLCKEGLTVPGLEYEWADNSRQLYKFRGAKILFYTERIMNELLRGGFSGLARNQFKVVGMPRLDSYFKLAKNNENPKKQLLFFSFYPENIFTYSITDEAKLKKVYQRTEDFHKWIISFALKCPDFKVIIKAKAAGHYLDYVKKILKENFKAEIKNLEIINFGNVTDLIKASTAVVGFNSTALIEAIILDKPIFSPHFGDIVMGKNWNLFWPYPELVKHIKAEADLSVLMSNLDKPAGQDKKIREDFLNFYVGNSDGKSSARAEAAIIETINEFQE